MMRFPAILLALVLASSAALAQSVPSPQIKLNNAYVPGATPGNIASFGTGGVVGDSGSGLDVLAFPGVDPTGATNSATGINNAITAACATTPPKEIFFPSGTYQASASISATCSGLTFRAVPGTATLKVSAGSSASPALLNIANVSNILVYGLTLDGNLSGVPAGNNVNTVYNASGVVFDHVAVQNTRGIGVVFSTGVTGSGIRDSSFNNVGNYWKTSGNTADQQQAVAFCCGLAIATSAAQGGTSAVLTFLSTSGVAVGQLVSGTYIPVGAYVASLTSTTVTLNAPSTSTIPSGESVSFYSNSSNFVRNSSFNSTGLDAISIAGQSDFDASGNYCYLAGGQNSNGGACIYAAGDNDLKVTRNISIGALGNGIDLLSQYGALVEGNTAYKSSSRGIAVDTSTNVIIRGNDAADNQQYTAANGSGGINISGTSANITLSANSAYDDQATKTQPYGIGVTNGSTITNLFIGPDNLLAGNLSGEVGGGYGSEGANSVDLQRGRTSQNFNAAGSTAVIGGGSNNTANGAYSTIPGGTWNVTTGQGSLVSGQFAQDRYRNVDVFASGQNANGGDAQSVVSVLRALTTSTTPIQLGTSGGGVASTSTCVNLPNINFSATQTSIYGMDIDIVAIDTTTAGNLNHYHDANATLYRTGAISTTAYVAGATPLSWTLGTAGTIAVSADTTNACVKVMWTAPNADTWHVVARVITTEAY